MGDRVFPKVLYLILQEAADRGFEHVVSWNTHGQSFKIHNRQAFLKQVLVDYGIHQSQYKSLVRQLNLWGFQCIHGGRQNAERGSYYHPSFLRDEPDLVATIQRCRVKGKQTRKACSSIVVSKKSLPSVMDDDDSFFVPANYWEDDDNNFACFPQAFPLTPEIKDLADDILGADLFADNDDDDMDIPPASETILSLLEDPDADIFLEMTIESILDDV